MLRFFFKKEKNYKALKKMYPESFCPFEQNRLVLVGVAAIVQEWPLNRKIYVAGSMNANSRSKRKKRLAALINIQNKSDLEPNLLCSFCLVILF